ncbi:MAG: 23S rRNA (adenine(2503)-C(2))-methyltransferase RlmN [Candidatus Margulisbacteria bacterium]|jgi:23S rRNA (adenine2503-C2)-methyltransferase|nr:23S rRNA (adenine(2503)-C(2))-methyltransferase RlmN [Candidatus Margulisiibacteriota bacterium]
MSELTWDEIAATGLKPDKAKALFRAYHQRFEFAPPLKVEKAEGEANVEKVRFRLADGLAIEAVFMDHGPDKKFVCVSSQVGCPIGCRFCATGQMGFKRNLTVSEIISQVYHFAGKQKITNLVFMGMGEPFLNYDRVLKAVTLLNSELGQNIASRKIVVSTVGIVTGIRQFAGERQKLKLAWSLAAPSDELRQRLVPYPALPTIEETIKAITAYQQKTKQRVTIEYVLLKGVNDSEADLHELDRLARQIDSHINLIEYNPSPGLSFAPGDTDRARLALKKLKANVTVRRSLGKTITAGCGQLATQPD